MVRRRRICDRFAIPQRASELLPMRITEDSVVLSPDLIGEAKNVDRI
jgi:hypothetical protein